MIFKRFYADSIAQASFLVGCDRTGEAAVVDPTRDLQPYLDFAVKEGLRIVAVTETHIHADFVSGSRELAGLTGATLYLSKEGGADWQYAFRDEPNVCSIGDEDQIVVGKVRLKAVHTPGHTPEHLTFLLIDGAATDQPVGAFTGDFIFAGDVGRPDLLEVAAGFRDTMRQGAETLFESVSRFKRMPDWLTLWPGHGAGSACGKKLGGVPSTTLGYEKLVNPSVRTDSKQVFVEDILAGQPEPPLYFARMKKVNKEGPTPTLNKWNVPEISPSPEAQLVDVRSYDEFVSGSLPNAISIRMNASFSKWAGSLLDPVSPIVPLANDEEQASEAAKAMFLIGLENVIGWARPTAVEKVPILDAGEASAMRGTWLDVRGSSERGVISVRGSIHIPLVYLATRIGEVPAERILTYCESGGRALTAAAYLRSRGVDAVAVDATIPEINEELNASLFPT